MAPAAPLPIDPVRERRMRALHDACQQLASRSVSVLAVDSPESDWARWNTEVRAVVASYGPDFTAALDQAGNIPAAVVPGVLADEPMTVTAPQLRQHALYAFISNSLDVKDQPGTARRLIAELQHGGGQIGGVAQAYTQHFGTGIRRLRQSQRIRLRRCSSYSTQAGLANCRVSCCKRTFATSSVLLKNCTCLQLGILHLSRGDAKCGGRQLPNRPKVQFLRQLRKGRLLALVERIRLWRIATLSSRPFLMRCSSRSKSSRALHHSKTDFINRVFQRMIHA